MADDPPAASSTGDGVDAPPLSGVRLTDTQRAILTALCRPRADGNRYATPATNQEIAAQVFLSVDAVKAHLRALYRKFGVEPLPHNQKRARLVELVIEGGLIPAGEPGAGGGDQASPTPAPSPAPDPDPVEAAKASAAAARAAKPGGPGGRADHRFGRSRRCSPGAGAGSHRYFLRGLVGRLSGAGQYPGPLPGSGQRLLPARPRGPDPTRRRFDSRACAQLPRCDRDDGRTPRVAGATRRRQIAIWRCSATDWRRAADYTSLVAQGPPRAGSRESANEVAELTLAAGQVQAGALGYGLGRECSEIGSLVARSARNAAVTR